jgi:hypothetical protein
MSKVVVSARVIAALQDDRLTKAFERERGRLRGFIRRRVADIDEADDIRRMPVLKRPTRDRSWSTSSQPRWRSYRSSSGMCSWPTRSTAAASESLPRKLA